MWFCDNVWWVNMPWKCSSKHMIVCKSSHHTSCKIQVAKSALNFIMINMTKRKPVSLCEGMNKIQTCYSIWYFICHWLGSGSKSEAQHKNFRHTKMLYFQTFALNMYCEMMHDHFYTFPGVFHLQEQKTSPKHYMLVNVGSVLYSCFCFELKVIFFLHL